jgi:hypothetical protein
MGFRMEPWAYSQPLVPIVGGISMGAFPRGISALNLTLGAQGNECPAQCPAVIEGKVRSKWSMRARALGKTLRQRIFKGQISDGNLKNREQPAARGSRL